MKETSDTEKQILIEKSRKFDSIMHWVNPERRFNSKFQQKKKIFNDQ